MAGEFDIKMDMRQLTRFFQIAPRETKKATGRLLNDMAFSHRDIAMATIGSRHIIRDKRFLSFALQVKKADLTQAPFKQRAISGSIRTDRFTGWVEDLGIAPKRNRLIGSNARGGNIRAKAKVRLMPELEFEKPSNYSDIPARQRIPAMLSILSRNPDYTSAGKGMFIIEGQGWAHGLYTWTNKKTQAAYVSRSKKKTIIRDKRDRTTRDYPAIKRVQTFGRAPKGQRFNWPGITINRLMAYFDAVDSWRRYFGPLIDQAKR
jgi:hypothetical protein